jgi:two-component system, NarL family, sensor histidine kinase UhpB
MRREIKPYSMLVVEDNPGDYFLLQHYLELSKLPIQQVLHACSMAELPGYASDHIFDIIVFSGLTTVEIAKASISLGAQDYLVKGEFDEKLLEKSVQYSIERKKVTETIRESNELYEYVNKATRDTIWQWNYLTGQGYWGEGIIETFGYAQADSEYNESWLALYTHPEDKERVIKNQEAHISSGLQTWQDEFRFRCANGTYKYVNNRAFILYDKCGKPYRMIGAITDVTEKVQEELRINKAILDAQEQERRFIGSELHDNINQILAGTLLTLGVAKTQLPGNTPADKYIIAAISYINKAIYETRALSHQLAPTVFKGTSLKDNVEDLLAIMNVENRFTIQFTYDEINNVIVADDIQLNLYRILQEQLKNILKYSEAAIIEIEVSISKDLVSLRIFDNGKGFDTSMAKNGIGLGNMNKRAEALSGKFILNSAPGKGCEIIIEIPHWKDQLV